MKRLLRDGALMELGGATRRSWRQHQEVWAELTQMLWAQQKSGGGEVGLGELMVAIFEDESLHPYKAGRLLWTFSKYSTLVMSHLSFNS